MVKRSSVGEVRSLRSLFVEAVVIFSVIAQSPRAGAQPVQMNRGDEYLALIEDSVQKLAEKLAEVYPSECDADDPEPCGLCTQDECHPMNGTPVCANVTKNTRCNAHYPGCPSSIRVTKERSCLAYPRESIDALPDRAQTRTICRTQGLDATFIELFERNPYHADYYVGFPDGSRRSYPGREEADENSLYSCSSYDCRKRPWYNSAISNQNHLVILVDSRKVPLDPSFTERGDTLNLSKQYAKALLDTVYYEDRINVVAFDSESKANALKTSSVVVGFNDTDPQNHVELKDLLKKIDEILPAEDDVKLTSSNLTSGLQEALGLFAAAETAVKMTKNVIVFTNGDILQDEVLNRTLDEISSSLVRLFIFSIKSSKSTDENLQILSALADRTRGIHITLTSTQNPLYQLRSYFGYQALMQKLSGRSMPFWTPAYADYYDIGKIITVTVPAFSKTVPTRFIGVAAIDVLYLEIGDIKDDFQQALHNRPTQKGVIDKMIFQSTRPYDDSFGDPCMDLTKDASEMAMCKTEKKIDPAQNFLDRLCCDNCAGSHSEPRVWIYIVGSIGGVFSLSLIWISICVYRKRRSPAPKVEADFSLHDDISQATFPRDDSGKAAQRLLKDNMQSGTPQRIHQTLSRLCVDKLPEPNAKL
ncbi:hypothetical protein Mapa_009031 [Marchantia paleacea]|nr:hypothetical protein Mapa_009031 [Marchantia paleacea]